MSAVSNTTRIAILLGLFVAELAGIARSRFSDDRYFAWAPLHEVTELRITVDDRGRILPFDEVAARYAIPRSARVEHTGIARELNDADPLLSRIRRIECARREPASVRVGLLRNGRASEVRIRCR